MRHLRRVAPAADTAAPCGSPAVRRDGGGWCQSGQQTPADHRPACLRIPADTTPCPVFRPASSPDVFRPIAESPLRRSTPSPLPPGCASCGSRNQQRRMSLTAYARSGGILPQPARSPDRFRLKSSASSRLVTLMPWTQRTPRSSDEVPCETGEDVYLTEGIDPATLRWIFLPFGRFRSVWDVFVLALVAYTAVSLDV